MTTKIRTLNFLPEIFQTPTNSQFLGATLDQLVDQPLIKNIEGYVGSKFGVGINAKDNYVTEPTKIRTDYQLDPGVVFTKENETTAKDFISYPGILDALKLQGGLIDNNSRLFESQFYTWDSFANLDKLINFNQYYWLPNGPDQVVVSTGQVFSRRDYFVTDSNNGYYIGTSPGATGALNPTLTLLRGGTYTFTVNQDTEFWIQGVPGITGFDPSNPNVQTRNVLGVTNNGAKTGVITFQVPFKDAQSDYPSGNGVVDVVSTLPFAAVNGQPVSTFGGIDGVTSLNGLTVLFYNTGIPSEIAYISAFYNQSDYDTNNNFVASETINITDTATGTNLITCNDTSGLTLGQTITFTGSAFGGLIVGQLYFVKSIDSSTTFTISDTLNGTTLNLSTASGNCTGNINQGLFEEGYYRNVNDYLFTITYVGPPGEEVIQLIPASAIPTFSKITAQYGSLYAGKGFFKNYLGFIELIPYNSAILDTLYYQDGTNPLKVGVIKLIESNLTNTLDVERDILGQLTYTAPNGVVFTNGLKVVFEGDVVPISYLSGQYYVEGVGTGIELIPVSDLVIPEDFTEASFLPYDTTTWDTTPWEAASNVPLTQDYITIARNSISKNAWSRSNRWFHIEVIQATAQYNNNIESINFYASKENKAKRPIIEFYPNIQLFDSGIVGKAPVDFIDTRTTDAFTYVAGQKTYFPDVAVYTSYSATIQRTDYVEDRQATATSATTNQITVNSVTGFRVNDIVRFNTTIDPVFGGVTANTTYYISSINSISNTITISEIQNGEVFDLTTYSGPDIMGFKWVPLSTEIVVQNAEIEGNFTTGQFITSLVLNDVNLIPLTATITNISGIATKTITISWSETASGYFPEINNASIIATDTVSDNYALFEGARVVFTADENVDIKNKIYQVRFSETGGESYPIITLTEAEDGLVEPFEQTVAIRGFFNIGKTFYYNGIFWDQAQYKQNVNQAPLFNIYNENGESLSNTEIYIGSSFRGTKLFSYGLGSGPNDSILGFPIRYSSVENIGDISFDVNLNSDTFDYIQGSVPVTSNINIGYVYDYTPGRTITSSTFEIGKYYKITFLGTTDWNIVAGTQNLIYRTGDVIKVVSASEGTGTGFNYFIRKLGWETAIAPSTQYQIFSFNYDPLVNTETFVCDVKILDIPVTETTWPTILVYNNNKLVPSTEYSVSSTSNTTTVSINITPNISTVIEILILSDQVSDTAYYSIPINLNNNPLNEDVSVVNIGDIRNQYRSAFNNNLNSFGTVFGSNNYRDLGNMVPYGNAIIQNSASLALVGSFLRKSDHNLFDALLFNSKEYIKFKTLLVDTVNNSDYEQRFNPAYMLDEALSVITASKTQEQSFFWSDMIPNKAPFVSKTYTFANNLDISTYPLYQTYNFDSANYNGVLVYLTRTINGSSVTQQLIINVDYIVSSTSPSLTVTKNLQPNDIITINEYTQTYGSYIPNTPTKLGLYPKFIPTVILDSNYNQPTYFIRGHDGSYTKLYGDYNPNTQILTDFRDQVLLEFETRVYNNIKVNATIPIEEYEITPGYFRNTDYSYDEWLNIYSTTFLNWVGENRIDYKKQLYNSANQFTYNYRDSGIKIDNTPIQQGYWRGLYQYFYDTSTPNSTPWEMIGYKDQPEWWESQYGAAPYTSNNLVLWSDMSNGYDYNNGNPRIIPQAIRPELLSVLPVNEAGSLLSPMDSIVGNFVSQLFKSEWRVGDDGPSEFSYRRSSSYPFDLMRLMALTKPAKFYNLAVDLDNYKYNTEFNQYLVDNRSHLKIDNIEIYGNGTAKTSYINWIVDYEKQVGLNATENIKTLLESTDVRLIYRLAGFSDKTALKFYVEKGSPNSNNASLLIPDESYQVLLYDNQPFEKIIYSSIVVQITNRGFSVFGNSQNIAYFTILAPKNNGNLDTITIEDLTVKVANDYTTEKIIVPYGTVFDTVEEVSNFITSYGAYLISQGMKFDTIENSLEVNWKQMVAEFLYWVQIGFEEGSLITLNPAAKNLIIDRDSYIVQPLTLRQTNFVLNQDLYPISSVNLNVYRENTMFKVNPLNEGDTLAYGQFNISNFEHGIVFDNITLFNDVIYNLITGLRQNRIFVRGTKSAEWNGTITASGFIYNQDNIKEWNKETKYTKGEIVTYKNKYWVALKIIQPNEVFEELNWKITDYNEIQKGLLPNSSTRSYESSLYYDVNVANLEKDADLLSFSLIGYRPRDYLALVDLTDITQVNVYKNMIRNKGTKNAASAFQGANLPQGGIDYTIFENWAIQSGEFGGVLNNNFVEFKLIQKYLTGNPAIVALTTSTPVPAAQQNISLNNNNALFNYGRPITDPNILPTIPVETPSKLLPDAGYVNFNDVKMSSYFYSNLFRAVDINNIIVPQRNFYSWEYVWIANYLQEWQVYTPIPMGPVIAAQNNLNGTVTIRFQYPHNLNKYQPFEIINFNPNINGYYIVALVLDIYSVVINLTLDTNIQSLTGNGIGMYFQSQRVNSPADIQNLPLLNTEFVKNKVWVDENDDGGWAVYRKSINYQYENEFTKTLSQTFGTSVATTSNLGYLIGDANKGEVYRYTYNEITQVYDLVQTLAEDTSFGTTIVHSDDIFVISQPTTNSSIFIYQLQNTTVSDDLVDYQTVAAPMGVTNWGSALALSGNKQWLYVSDIDNNSVHVYRQKYETVQAGYFVSGQTYIISTVGTTDFTLIGSTSNEVGTAFIATGVGTGSGTALLSTYSASSIIDGDVLGLSVSGDKFGYSLSTNYSGDTLVIGTPNKDYSASIDNFGYVYVFNRLQQKYESQNASNFETAQNFELAYVPSATDIIKQTASATTSGTDIITVPSTTGFSVNDAVIFYGGNFGISGIQPNIVYYIDSIPSGTTFKIKATKTSVIALNLNTDATVTFNCYVQKTPYYVSVNGTLVAETNYGIIRPSGSSASLIYNGNLSAGDIIQISTNHFIRQQTLTTEQTPQVGVHFGTSNDVTTLGEEILVGAPFQLNTQFEEGAVYRYTNGGAKFGIITGTSECNLTSNYTILLNGFQVNLTAGSASQTVNQINGANIPNIFASVTNNIITIYLIEQSYSTVNEKLLIVATDPQVFSDLGINPYTQTQIVECPHLEGRTQFGTIVKFNEFNSFVASAPVGIRYVGTTFDFTDDENLDNDTVFDNNATRWIDQYINAGAAYMFDYLGKNNESISDPGQYVYAQSINDISQNYGQQPNYATAIDFNDNRVIIGTSGFRPAFDNGQVLTFVNNEGVANWAVYRSSSAIVDVNGFNTVQIFSASTNNTIANLDYIDPLQGKLLGAVRQNLDFISNVDPAHYSSEQTIKTIRWGAEHEGQLWFDTSNVRFINYHQNDVEYNAKYWATLFPGSDVAVYTWVTSNVLPSQYQGPGVPYDTLKFTTQLILNSAGFLVPVYCFWARNTNIISSKINKTLSDSIIQRYIRNPQNSGISYMAPLLPNVFALYNTYEYINADDNNSDDYIRADDSVFHINFVTGTNKDPAHSQYTLIRSNNPDDFLPGLPSDLAGARFNFIGGIPNVNGAPESLYLKMLDSLCGVDSFGANVPDPNLPKIVQSGVKLRPRQSFFLDNFLALKNYLEYANSILKQFPIFEIRQQINFLFTIGDNFDTSRYWTRINWWAPGYDDATKSSVLVSIYADLATLVVPSGTIATVNENSAGLSETYIKNSDGTWTRIGLTNGTIQFSNYLWDYPQARLGWDGPYWDSGGFDEYPSEETRFIIRALNEEIFIDDLLIFRNRGLILLFEYIQSEAPENQNYLPWLNKTSLIDVSHTLRELLPVENYRTDNEVFLTKYIDEIKPYHVVVKEFIFKYTKTDPYLGNISDFDLPAQYNTANEIFVSPQITYGQTESVYQYNTDDVIWTTRPYNEWYQNYGLSLTGQNNFRISTLRSYIAINFDFMVVDNVSGFPTNGVVSVGNPDVGYEQIAYNYVDIQNGVIGGFTRGVNGTLITTHLPGEEIIIDLPGVLVLNGGRGYSEPPRVTAYIDTSIYPEPKRQAILNVVMSLDTVLSVEVVDPGLGYVVQPEIIIDPATVTTFFSSNVQLFNSTILVYVPTLNTGDLVQYKIGENTTTVQGLEPNQWYYIGVLENSPNYIIALYSSYEDALNNKNRIVLSSSGTGSNHTLNVGARAIPVVSSTPVRENIVTLRYDRTSYRPHVVDWAAGQFYASFYAGQYNNSNKISSSSINLQSTEPPISSILASAQGAVFEINSVSNDQILEWSNFQRQIDQVSAVTNYITLQYSAVTSTASGSTIGFTSEMPVKFEGATLGNIVTGVTYYIKDIISDSEFTISTTPGGSVFNPGTAVAPISGYYMYTGMVTNTAILNLNYPGIRNITATETGSNKLTVPMSKVGTGGTLDFYTNLPILFTGNVFAANELVTGKQYTILVVGDTDWTSIGAVSNTAGLVFTAGGPTIGTGLATGFTFGGVVENKQYYVTTVCDNETFTISENPNPVSITITESIASTDEIETSDTTENFNLNDPIIFNNFLFNASDLIVGQEYYIVNVGNTDWNTVAGTSGIVYTSKDIITVAVVGSGTGTATSIYYGDTTNYITQGLIYYVAEVTSSNRLKISTTINGGILPLFDVIGQAICTNQKDTLQLTTDSGIMTMNVNQPLSPGQINGQKFSLYNSSQQYTSLLGTIGNLLEREVEYTLATDNRIALSENTDNFYINMPFRVSSSIGGLTTGTTYYVTEIGTISIDVTATGASNELITTNTSTIYPNMPITFSGAGIGGVTIGLTYYVKNILSGTTFTISTELGGSTTTLFAGAGLMVGTGSQYIQASTSKGGGAVVLSNAAGPVNFTQYIPTIDNPEFSISYKLGGYSAYIMNAGEGWALTNTFTISGTLLGGTSPANDCTLTVNTIDIISEDVNNIITSNGYILDVICQGTPPDIVSEYYLKVLTPSTVGVYEDKLLSIPVSGINFPYNGITYTTATQVKATGVTISDPVVVVDDASIFAANDPIYFTGTVFGNIIAGYPYYIIQIDSINNELSISETMGGSAFTTGVATGSCTAAIAGDYAFLFEPFYFTPSIVKFNNKVWECVISNYDAEFITSKWRLLNSGDRRLNALDRIIGYYQPTINMPGLDMTQLVDGISYPNAIYYGNQFDPSLEYPINVILPSTTFEKIDADLTGVAFDGTDFISIFNTTEVSGLGVSSNSIDWDLGKISSVAPLGLKDIVYANNKYIIVTNNSAASILISDDYVSWSAIKNINSNLNSIASKGTRFVAVGDNIFTSVNTTSWNKVYSFTSGSNNTLYGVTGVNIGSFNGFITVGGGYIDYSLSSTPVPVSLIVSSLNGISWTQYNPPTYALTSKQFNSVVSDATMNIIVIVGEDGVIYASTDGANYKGVNETGFDGTVASLNLINVDSTIGLNVGDAIRFDTACGVIDTVTTYYIKTIPSSNTISISLTLGGPTLALTTANPIQTYTKAKLYLYPRTSTLNDVASTDGTTLIAVGDSGLIRTSTNGLNWTTQTSGVSVNLYGISYDSSSNIIVVVGDNNTILKSSDYGVTWNDNTVILEKTTSYTIQGDPFTSGYGPEELVPGIVKDQLTMIVNTLPGTNWEATEYENVGYGVFSENLITTEFNQTQFDFSNVTPNPLYIDIFFTSNTSGLSYRLNPLDYTVNYVTKIITLTGSAPLMGSAGTNSLRVDAYTVGNGYQLVKSNSTNDPIIQNEETGFDEIIVNCNYSAPIYAGNGLIRPTLETITISATATDSVTNQILLSDVSQLILNYPIVFNGTTFGGIISGTTYYIKEIDTSTNEIKVSSTFNSITGLAGTILTLSTATGTMDAEFEVLPNSIFTKPVVYYNGNKLTLGTIDEVTATNSGTNTVTVTTTKLLATGNSIIFSDTIFGGITPQTSYTILSIVDDNNIELEDPSAPGFSLSLSDATGGATFVSNDYAIGLAADGINAKLIFAGQYNSPSDYISYALLGETKNIQYGYTLPETQYFTYDGSLVYNLTNNSSGDNITNAVVEVNGLRVDDTDYSINSELNQITFSPILGSGDKMSVTTFNDTQRQYLTSQFGITGVDVFKISTINNLIVPYITSTIVTATNSVNNFITCLSTANFVVDQTIIFEGTSFGGIQTDGTVYYILSIESATEFTISTTQGGATFAVSTAAGAMLVYIGGQPAVRVTTTTNHNFSTNDIIRIDGVNGSNQLNGEIFYIHKISDTQFDLYFAQYNSGASAVNQPVTSVGLYTGGGYTWLNQSYYVITTVATSTTSGTDIITVGDTGNLVVGTPVYFNEVSKLNSQATLGGLIVGTVYYIREITSSTEFKVALTRGGSIVSLTSNSGTMYVTQWDQTNVDRLWITINGYRVPSSSLRLYDTNEIGILSEITSTDSVTISSMIPTATPEEETYLMIVDSENQGAVYRANSQTTTWLTQPLFDTDAIIFVNDVNKVTETITQNNLTPAVINGYYYIGLNADKNQINNVTVYNNNPSRLGYINNVYLSIEIIDLTPTLKITAGTYIDPNDNLTITILVGNIIYINGEQIKFFTVDPVNNALVDIQRGVNNTPVLNYHSNYSKVYSLLSSNLMPNTLYDETWNSENYNTINGDPLQISNTDGADFLKGDIN